MIRRLSIGFLLAVSLLALGVFWFVSTLDLNLHKEKIQQLVFDRTGRTLTIDGDIATQFFPWIGLQMHDVSLANAPGFEHVPFARVRSSDVQLELVPLLFGTFNVTRVTLDGLELMLQINDEGVANWEDLLNTTTVVETETDEEDVLQSVEAGAPLAAALSVGVIEVTDAMVQWVNEKERNDIELAQLNLTTDAFQLGKPFAFTTSFLISSHSAQVSSQVTASGSLAIDVNNHSYLLHGVDVKTSTQSEWLPLDVLDVDMTGNLLVNLKAQSFDLTELNSKVENIAFAGELYGTSVFEVPSFFGNVESNEFDLIAVLKEVGVQIPDTFDDSLVKTTRFSFAFQQSEEQLLLNQLVLSSADAQFNGDVQISNLSQSPVFSAQLSSNEFNPAPWASLAGWVSADPLVMQRASVTTAVRQSGQILSFTDLQLMLDDFQLSGNVEVTDIHAESPPLVFELHGSGLDVERYLPVSELSEPAVTPSVSKVQVPVHPMKVLDINGNITMDELSVAGVTLTDLVIPVVAKDGNINVTEAKASLYDGTLFNSVSVDVNVEPPLLKWSSNISAVQSDALLSDYLKSESPISGTGILNIDVLSRGYNLTEWLQAADGAVSLRFADGVIDGVSLPSEIIQAYNLLQGRVVAVEENLSTGFTELSVSGEISEGLLESDDLSMKAPWLHVTGEGSVELYSGQLEYLANLRVMGNAEEQGSAELAALDGLVLPVPITGTLSDVSVDFNSLFVKTLTTELTALVKKRLAETPDEQEPVKEVLPQTELLKEPGPEGVEVIIEENQEVLIDQIEQSRGKIKQSVKKNLEQVLEEGVSNLLGE